MLPAHLFRSSACYKKLPFAAAHPNFWFIKQSGTKLVFHLAWLDYCIQIVFHFDLKSLGLHQ
jgi:hypothetical protein